MGQFMKTGSVPLMASTSTKKTHCDWPAVINRNNEQRADIWTTNHLYY